MKIAFTNDHAAAAERDRLVQKIQSLGHEVADYGTHGTDSVDYPGYAATAARALSKGEVDRAILVCGSGIGMSIVANKFRGVRCALVTDLWAAEQSRRHNDANCLALRSREQSADLNDQIIEKWLNTPFEGGRHERRVNQISDYEHREPHKETT